VPDCRGVSKHSRTHSQASWIRSCGRADGRVLARKFSHFCQRKSRGEYFRYRKAQASSGCQTTRLSTHN